MYRDNREYVYSFALRLVNYDKQKAEDLTQETFYNAFLSFHRFNGKCDIKTWLCAIAKNQFCKKAGKMKLSEIPLDSAENIAGDGCVQKTAEISEMYESVMSGIMRLKKKTRDVMILRLFSELSFAQIGSALKITENTAKVTFHRGKTELKEMLKGDYFDEIQ